MIRDPSDGTVKNVSIETEQAALVCDHPDVETAGKSEAATRSTNEINDLILTSASGLPLESQKPEAQAKLEKSRLWLKDYFHRRPEQGT